MWEIAAVYKQFQAITKQVIEYHIEKKEMRAQVCLSVVDLLLVAFLVGSVVLLRVPFLAIAFRHYQLAEPNPIEPAQLADIHHIEAEYEVVGYEEEDSGYSSH